MRLNTNTRTVNRPVTVTESTADLDTPEVALVLDGLEALARESATLADAARRLGQPAYARDLDAKARAARDLVSQAKSVSVTGITVSYS